MSARTKVRGNRAVTCDIDGCSSTYVAAWWGNGANEARWQAQDHGWTRCLTFGEGKGAYTRFIDICPEHTEHPKSCICLRMPVKQEGPEASGLLVSRLVVPEVADAYSEREDADQSEADADPVPEGAVHPPRGDEHEEEQGADE